MTTPSASYNKFFLLSLLGMLTALATVVNNMFSPAMPALAQAMGCDASATQLCLTASMAGLALGQLIIGPLSDRLGRRMTLLCSMIAYVVASLALLVAPSMGLIVALRLLQGLSAGGGIVISRSVATDVSTGNGLLKMLAAINVINGLMPIVTPLLGGYIVSAAGYKGAFAAMAVVGLVLLAGCFRLKETLQAENRTGVNLSQTMTSFAVVLRNRQFLLTIVHQGGALAVLFGNIAATPFILQSYGYGPGSIGMALGINGIFTAIGAGLAPSLGGSLRGMRISAWGLAILAVLQAVVLWNAMGLWFYEALVCLMLFMVGITLTSSSTHAMECERSHAGTASALLGAVGFIAGAVAAPLIGLGDVLHSTAVVYALAALLTLAVTIPIKENVKNHG